VPPDIKQWLDEQAEENVRSRNAEIVAILKHARKLRAKAAQQPQSAKD
jgi:hypothetical protein